MTSPVKFGAEHRFVLKNPAWKLIAMSVFVLVLGFFPYFINDTSGRGQLMRIVFGPLLLLIGGFFGVKGVKLSGLPDGHVRVTTSRLLIERPGGESTEVDLETIDRVWHISQRGQPTALRIELRHGSATAIPSAQLVGDAERVLAALLGERSALRRAGITRPVEMAAAEAFHAARRVGVVPFAVAVRKKGKGDYDVEIVESRNGLTRAPKGALLFVPKDVLRVLQQTGEAPRDAKPLRGTKLDV